MAKILECYCLKKRKNIPARKNPMSDIHPGSAWGSCVCAVAGKGGRIDYFKIGTTKIYPISGKHRYELLAKGLKEYPNITRYGK